MKLSICIVNWNTRDLLTQCIKSVYETTHGFAYEIIVVDNNSSDNSVDQVRKMFPDVRLIVNNENRGFAAANNQAIKVAQGEYVLLLNSDTVVLSNALEILVKFMDKHPEAGACGSKRIKPDGSLDMTVRGEPTIMGTLFHLLGLNKVFPDNRYARKYYLTDWDHNTLREVPKIGGACLMLREKTLDQVGLLDERFFMYGEDVDLCYRIKGGGWRIYYVPQSVIIHYLGGSSRKASYRMIGAYYKSIYLFYKKHYAKPPFSYFNWLVFSGIALRAVITMLLNVFKKSKEVESNKKAYVNATKRSEI